MKTIPRKQKLRFQLEEPRIHHMSLISLDLIVASLVQWPLISMQNPPLSIFMLFFSQIFQLILEETNRYFHKYTPSKNTASTSAQSPDIAIGEIYTFFVITVPMGHDQRGSLKDYWSSDEQYCTPFYSDMMPRDHFFHILRFLHFEDSDTPPSCDDPDYDRLWKIRKIFDTLSNKFCEMYNPTEHLAMDEFIMF